MVLSGGGSRAAYQVGVLSAIADLLPNDSINPFPIICGTSAGAINAIALAGGALHFREAILRLTEVWEAFSCDAIYRTEWHALLRSAVRFAGSQFLGLNRDSPVSLLDNSPLKALLSEKINFNGIAAAIARRRLRAVSITAFGYESGHAVSFYQGRGSIDPWMRHRRVGVPTRLGVEHLLASSAIPLIFPPVKIHREFFGDGAVRQQAPISPALHLGADKVLVVGVSSNLAQQEARESRPRGEPPSLAQIVGHMLNSTFVDSLEGDIELLDKINRMALLLPNAAPTGGAARGFKPVDVLVISPSKPIDVIAARHRRELPASLRFFLGGSGATRSSGGSALSYLLFEQGFCRELIELGYQDAMAQRDKLMEFLGLVCRV
nr:patatin-like phospholipase family protein [Atopomonas sediminilitoris]